jgi:hypothetical protein
VPLELRRGAVANLAYFARLPSVVLVVIHLVSLTHKGANHDDTHTKQSDPLKESQPELLQIMSMYPEINYCCRGRRDAIQL